MYFTKDDGYQHSLVFTPVLSSLILDNINVNNNNNNNNNDNNKNKVTD